METENLQRVCPNFVTTSPQPEAQLERALASILAEARSQVAAGREPNTEGFEARIAAAARLARAGGADPAVVDRAEANARRRLRPIASVHRARGLVAREAAPPKSAAAPRRPLVLRTKPTITGTLDVRRADGDGFRLAWDAVPAVTEWEVRFSERRDVRSEYVERETLVLAADVTSVEVPLGDSIVRVNILGRGRRPPAAARPDLGAHARGLARPLAAPRQRLLTGGRAPPHGPTSPRPDAAPARSPRAHLPGRDFAGRARPRLSLGRDARELARPDGR